MPSYADCIDIALKAKRITSETAEAIRSADDPQQAIDELSYALSQQRREAAIQAIRLDDAWKNINSYKDSKGNVDMYGGLMALLGKDPKGKAPYANVDLLSSVYEAKYHSMFAEGLSKMRTKKFGLAHDENVRRDFVKALYGDTNVDPEIRQLADDWNKLSETMRNEFNAKGGAIKKNNSWLLPQKHDARNIYPSHKKSYDKALAEWKESITPLLDRQKMSDDMGRPLTPKELDKSLDYVFETIVTGGANKADDFTAMPELGKKLSRKGSESRFLYFKDAESWLTYQDMYGKGDILTTLTDHINMMSHDVAKMEVLGTNPQNLYDALMFQIERESGISGFQKAKANALFKVATGAVDQGELTGLVDFTQSTRNVLTAALLGKAFLSALSDTGFSALTSRYHGIPAFNSISTQLSLMNPANEADRILAVKIGLTAESWIGRAHAANRYADVYGNGATAKMAEGVMRASLLEPWTDAGRKAFGMEFSAMLADNFGKSFDELPKKLRRSFDTYGIDEADWADFRASKTLNHKGARFADLTKSPKFNRMVLSEMDYAVPTPDARVRAITTGGAGRATVGGQLIRSATMLKSFTVTLGLTHLYRAAYQASAGDRLAYAAFMMASTSILGGIALQAKDIAAGREPRKVDGKFMAAAVMQGGGLGIFGDLLFSDVNRFGGGPAATLSGPMGELLNKTTSLTLGNIQQAVKREETNVLGEAAQYVRRYSPSIWQVDVVKGALFDQLSIMADPGYEKRLNRIRRNRMEDYGQEEWWRRGEVKPEFLQ